jgi:CRP-like cAMP-binding protein
MYRKPEPPSDRPPPAVAGTTPDSGRPTNRLLAALPSDAFERLRPDLRTIEIRTKHVLQNPLEPIQFVYFPNGGVISITTVLSDGTAVEAATVGDEGMLGIEAFLRDDAIAPGETLVQVPDTNGETLTAEMLGVEAFRREVSRHAALHDQISEYTQVVIAQMMQTTACNVLHDVRQRCARWLLMTLDRMHQNDFILSHEFLGVMLGVKRQTVSVVAGDLQRAGLIRYTHGHVVVLDRPGLEAAACACYPIIRSYFVGLRPQPPALPHGHPPGRHD